MSSNAYDKMSDYIQSVYQVVLMLRRKVANLKASSLQDCRLGFIALVILNYVRSMAAEYEVDLDTVTEPLTINLIPIFEYIAANNVELYDFSKIKDSDVDVNKKEDIERFVLTHIYYITQGK